MEAPAVIGKQAQVTHLSWEREMVDILWLGQYSTFV